MAKMMHGTVATSAIVLTSIEVFYRGTRTTEILRVTEGARVSESTFYQRAQSEKDLPQPFIEDHDANWLRWFEREIDAKFETSKVGLEIIADVLRKWFENSRLQCSGANTVVCFSQLAGETLESFENHKDRLRRFVEQLVVKMGLRYPDIAATAAIQIIERTIMRTLISGDLSEIKTAQLLFQCLQRALWVGFN